MRCAKDFEEIRILNAQSGLVIFELLQDFCEIWAIHKVLFWLFCVYLCDKMTILCAFYETLSAS